MTILDSAVSNIFWHCFAVLNLHFSGYCRSINLSKIMGKINTGKKSYRIHVHDKAVCFVMYIWKMCHKLTLNMHIFQQFRLILYLKNIHMTSVFSCIICLPIIEPKHSQNIGPVQFILQGELLKKSIHMWHYQRLINLKNMICFQLTKQQLQISSKHVNSWLSKAETPLTALKWKCPIDAAFLCTCKCGIIYSEHTIKAIAMHSSYFVTLNLAEHCMFSLRRNSFVNSVITVALQVTFTLNCSLMKAGSIYQ